MVSKKEPELNRPASENEHTPDQPDQEVHLGAYERPDEQINLKTPGIESCLRELVKEIKRKRRWSIFTRTVFWLLLLGLLAGWFFSPGTQITGDHTALVKLEGVISEGTDASAENVLKGLTRAFEADSAKGIILGINSPGGSPVQADLLYREITRLKAEHNKPLIAVIADVGASGGYYAAASADTIYANPSSLVGSIGVLMNSFGFVELMDKIGIERRLLTSGQHKAALDPFSPLKEGELVHAKSVIDGVHRQFIQVVRSSRGSRLKETGQTFSGQFWNGEQAYEMGLTDGYKTPWEAARDDIGEETIIDYTHRPDVLEQFSRTLSVAIANSLATIARSSFPELK